VLNICFKYLFVLLTCCVCLFAENLAYLTDKTDYKDPAKFHDVEFEYMNLPAIYMLGALAASQSMAKVGFAFKSVKNSELIMSKRFPTLDGLATEHECVSGAPYITRQTLAYAVSLSVSALFYAVNDESNTGRADEVYDKALRDMEQLSDAKFDECLGGLLQFYVQNVNSPEPPGPGTMPLSRQEVAVNNRARGASNDAGAAADDYNVALAVARADSVAPAPASAPADAPAVARADRVAPADAPVPADAPTDAGDSDSSVAKSSSGSDNESGAKTNSASKDTKKAGGRGRAGAVAPAVRGGAAAAAPKSPPPAAAKRGRGGGRG
jgi:hypothetical protein